MNIGYKFIARSCVTLNFVVLLMILAVINVPLSKGQYANACLPGIVLLCNVLSIMTGYRFHRMLTETEEKESTELQ